MPKPRRQFSRPSIDLGVTSARREWKHIPVQEVVEGDTIAEFGELESKDWQGEDLIITSTFQRVERLSKDTLVHAYVLASKDPE